MDNKELVFNLSVAQTVFESVHTSDNQEAMFNTCHAKLLNQTRVYIAVQDARIEADAQTIATLRADLDKTVEGLEALSPQQKAIADKGMPVGGSDRVKHYFPWRIFNHNTAQRNHSQSLLRLAERGGLSWCEAAAIIEIRPWFKMNETEAEKIVRSAAQSLIKELRP